METPIRILGIAGSLRRGSYNRAALRAATELAPKSVTIETAAIFSTITRARGSCTFTHHGGTTHITGYELQCIANSFAVVFYGPRNFCCKTTQSCATPWEPACLWSA